MSGWTSERWPHHFQALPLSLSVPLLRSHTLKPPRRPFITLSSLACGSRAAHPRYSAGFALAPRLPRPFEAPAVLGPLEQAACTCSPKSMHGMRAHPDGDALPLKLKHPPRPFETW